MIRKLALPALVLALVSGCASTASLTQHSQEKLAAGDHWKAWQLATRALDREPGNPKAREAATAAGNSIGEEWIRKIHATAGLDSLQAAEEVLNFVDFRAGAARYATLTTPSGWTDEERALRRSAARTWYARGVAANEQKRPKQAYVAFHDCDRFVSPWRDAAKLADRAFEKAVTRVAVLPFRASGRDVPRGDEVADAWRTDLTQGLDAGHAQFTRVLGTDDVEHVMTVSQLDDLSRDDAVKLARQAGAQRVVWGSIGGVKSSTRLEFFKDVVCRRITARDQEGHETTRWVDVPIEVVARVRDVTVGLDYELLSTKDGASLMRRHLDRSTEARVVWTSYQPEGDCDSYALVSDATRASNPSRAKEVETRWKAVAGDNTTIAQVLQARLASAKSENDGRYDRKSSLPRFLAGTAFVFMQELPPTEDLAFAAVAKGSTALRDDLLKLDPIDDVDLGVSVAGGDSR